MTAIDVISQKCSELEKLRSELDIELRTAKSRFAAFQDIHGILTRADASGSPLKKVEDKRRKEKQNIENLEAQFADINNQLSAFQETRKLLDRQPDQEALPELRPGSELFQVRDAIRKSGQPMNLSGMVAVIGKDDSVKARNSLRASVARYVGTIFVKTAANTFGLVELDHKPVGTGLPTDTETINFEEPL